MSERPLGELERIHREYGPGLSERKLALLEDLSSRILPTARAVHRLHEVLCFLRAYPDSLEVLARVEEMLGEFARRRDLRRQARDLVDSGIAGTTIYYSFFHPTAQWLARRHPTQLTVSWSDLAGDGPLEHLLPLLGLPAEMAAFDELTLPVRDWVDRMKGPQETDAAFLLRRVAALKADTNLREAVFEDLGLMFKLAPGRGTPSRTLAHHARGRTHCQVGPLETERPDLRRGLRRRPRRVTDVPVDEARRLIDLAREAMVVRGRDLDAFAYGDPRDVRIVDCGDGLEFVAIGLLPERRLLLEAVYGFLTLKNGVPIGYVLNSALFGSAEVAFNVFDTYRGAEAARVYGWVLAVLRYLFRATTFTIFPYQLGGAGNDEGLRSGAWWFYQKLGFRPRAPEALLLMNEELERMRAAPAHRSSRSVLRRLAEHNVYFQLGRPREDVIGEVPLPNLGLAAMDTVARRFGSDRERGEAGLGREMARLLGATDRRRWSADERLAFLRWAPLVASLPGVAGWSANDRRALAAVMRAKGGRREADYVRRFDAHRRLRRAILTVARTSD